MVWVGRSVVGRCTRTKEDKERKEKRRRSGFSGNSLVPFLEMVFAGRGDEAKGRGRERERE